MKNLLQTKKELAASLGRSRRFATDMEHAGFRLPATEQDAVNFLQAHPHPSRYRPGRNGRRDEDEDQS